MKTLIPVLLLLLAPALLRAETRLDGAGISIPRNLIASGGGLSSGGGLALDSSVGESAVAGFAAPTLDARPGLMEFIAQPGSVVSITAVTKDTDTLQLSWSAPGLDGFVAGVVSGYYRVDASSDPLHVFAPTEFLTEFSTTVIPGDAQAYTLTGLLPNTTYYSRIYLADARKFFAETSVRSDESTLARVPAAPAFSGVFTTSVTISWTVPAGGAAGYGIDSSSTNFGALLPGGVVVTSRTPSGLAVTLTVTGLDTATTYYFNLGSLNWQGQANFSVVMSTLTRPYLGLPPVYGLALSADNLNRRVTLTWSNPVYPNPSGVTLVVSTNPIVAGLTGGAPYPLGTVLSDGSLVKSTISAVSFVETSLPLDVTGYFSLYSRNASNAYSVAVSTQLVLDLPPMAPAGLGGELTADGSSITLTWSRVASSLDGTGFRSALSPTTWELHRYEVYRSTGIMRPNWVLLGTATVDSSSYAAGVPVTGGVYYYKVVPRDAFQSSWTDEVMAVDTLGNLYALGGDQVTRLQIPPALARTMRASGNSYGKALLVRASDRPEDLGGRIVRSVAFDPYAAPDNLPAPMPSTDQAGLAVTLRYETVAGNVVPSGMSTAARPAAPLTPAVLAPAARDWLAAYYVDGRDAAKVFGTVDPVDQTVRTQTSFFGNYQIRSVLRDQAFALDLSGVSNKVLTPNGDGLNDTVVFTFDNPKDSAVSGALYDVRGRFVSDMSPGPVAGASLMWDGKAGGAVVPRGVYIYRVLGEGKSFSGTVVVIR